MSVHSPKPYRPRTGPTRREQPMSHLTVDRRDWTFLLHEHIGVERLLDLPAYSEFDRETLDSIVEEGIRFAEEKIAPLNEISDRVGVKLVDGRVQTPEGFAQVFRELADNGWLAATHSPEFGGMGVPLSVSTAYMEAMNAACQAFFMYGGLTHAAGHLVETFGSDEMKAKYVEKMYNGTFGGTMCLTEPHAGTAVGDLRTSATPQDDGTFLIEGNKIWISGGDADFYGNVIHLVLARVKGDPEGTKGISLFVVPRILVNDDGSLGEYNNVEVGGIEHKMGINGSATCAMVFGDAGPTRGWIVGERCQGIRYMFQMMNEARIACGLQGASLANASFQQALAFAKDRKQGPDIAKKNMDGPSVEIIQHPDVRRNLLFMKAYSEGTRALLAHAAYWGDLALHATDDAERTKAQDMIDLVTPIAKAYSTDKGFKVTELGIQVFGGSGYCQDYPVEQYMRDIKISSIYEGTNGIQALDLLGRKMRQKGGALFMTYIMDTGEWVEAHKDHEIAGDVVKAVANTQGKVGEVAFWISSTAKQDIRLGMLQATPFLEIMGDLMVGRLLAEQAIISAAALQEKYGKTSFSTEERENDSEIAFYTGKIDSARFFAAEVLTLSGAKARAMMSGATAALDIVF
ncbi:MAG: acyl-CoA dehydrogenase [Deltaproteobacteria bacterium]|nr:MAG: acyl-CoA dehydrogenase [Deltaproteobacteria bacterium]